MSKRAREIPAQHALSKQTTGSSGLDEMLHGGLPAYGTTLVVGGPGTGKTVLGLQFLAGGLRAGEGAVLLTFDESADDLLRFSAGLDFSADLRQAGASDRLAAEHVQVDREEFSGSSGAGYVESLRFRILDAVQRVGAKRIFVDGLDAVFSHGFTDPRSVRVEFKRLVSAVKESGATVMVSAERGEGSLTRGGLEEYVADCVLLLEQRTVQNALVRRLRIVKYRGSGHALDAASFFIDRRGVVVRPYGMHGLTAPASSEKVSTGVPELDQMMEGGPFRNTVNLVTGTPGAGKTTLVGACAVAACERGEAALFVAFEESPAEVRRNLTSVGMDAERWEEAGLLFIHSARPQAAGLDEYLYTLQKYVDDHSPSVVVLDAASVFRRLAGASGAGEILTQLTDMLKEADVTIWMTVLAHDAGDDERTTIDVSSHIDSWIMLRNKQVQGEMNRTLTILKARGMAHSNQVREFLITSDGIKLVDVYVGPDGVLTGSARVSRENVDRLEAESREATIRRLEQAIEYRRALANVQSEELAARVEAEVNDIEVHLADAMIEKELRAADVRRLRASRAVPKR